MSRYWKKMVMAIAVIFLAYAGYGVYQFANTVRHIPEAYAAWDTGALLVEYMDTHDGAWPRSWDDLLTVLEAEAGEKFFFSGATAGDMNYASSLSLLVAIDWSFDSKAMTPANPVTCADGLPFDTLFEGADPNEMVREYLEDRAVATPDKDR